MKYFMPSTPEIYPESKPKKIPPNEAKAHMRYAFRVTGASIRDKSAVATRPPGAIVGSVCCCTGIRYEGGFEESRRGAALVEDDDEGIAVHRSKLMIVVVGGWKLEAEEI
jgi:hypothetical protein